MGISTFIDAYLKESVVMELENNIIKIIGKIFTQRYIIAILGILLFACSYNLFVLPNDLVYGGIGGIVL